MKNNRWGKLALTSVIAALFLLNTSEAFAQLKVGGEPSAIDANANLEVEASTAGRSVKVNRTTGQLTLKDGTEGAGKVLTSDADGNASWNAPGSASDVNFYAYFTGTKSTNATVTNKIDFTTVQPNIGNGFDPATDRFVAPIAGIYYFLGSAYVHVNTGAVQTYKDVLCIKVNSVARITQENFQYQTTAGNAFSIPLVTRLEVGDVVELFCHSTKPGALLAGYANSINAPQTTFQGFLIGR